jgi:hypothetical protein
MIAQPSRWPGGGKKRDRSDIDKIGSLELPSSACREPLVLHLGGEKGGGREKKQAEKRDRSDIDKIGSLELPSSACREPLVSHLVGWCSTS